MLGRKLWTICMSLCCTGLLVTSNVSRAQGGGGPIECLGPGQHT